jgi:serine/threonine protein kinase
MSDYKNRTCNIKNILKDNELECLIDLDNVNTESFVNVSDKIDTKDVLKKKNLDFSDVMNKIGGKLVYVKSGSTGHTFRGFNPQNKNDPHFAVKIVGYPKRENYGMYDDVRRPENAELNMLKVLSYFVINNQTPHLVLPIGTFNTDINPFLSLSDQGVVNDKKYSQFINRYKKGDLYDKVSILISEWADGGDLLEYIKKNKDEMTVREWRVLFFQILSALSVIQSKYPGFRHNDLKANNILIQKIGSRNRNNKFKYKINNKTYVIPNIGIQVKIWDFDFACIKGIVDNTKVDAKWTDKININSKMNRYYDLHYFFNTLTRKGFFPEFWKSKSVPKAVKEFVRRIIPEKYTVGENIAERGRILINDEYTYADKILKEDEFFNVLRPENEKV